MLLFGTGLDLAIYLASYITCMSVALLHLKSVMSEKGETALDQSLVSPVSEVLENTDTPPTNSRCPSEVTECNTIEVMLMQKNIWKQLFHIGNEMVVTQGGR